MRFIAVVLSVYALVFASGAIAETSSDKSDKQNATQHENVEGQVSRFSTCETKLMA